MEVQPPKWQFLNEDEKEELMKNYNGRQLDWCQVGENKCFLPYTYAEKGEAIWRTKVRPTDRWVVTFPRSGKSTYICSLYYRFAYGCTTWVQELVWLVNNDLNYEEAAKKPIEERFYFTEFEIVHLNSNEVTKENKKGLEKSMQLCKVPLASNSLESLPSPRFIKTHLALEMLPPGLLDTGCKVVYVARNPKDVVVSYYHMITSKKDLRYTGNFPSFWNFFLRNLKLACPYWSHVKQAWSLRQHPNLLFLFFEEMKMDMPNVIKKVAEFYGRPCTADDIAKLAQHLDFENFKKNPMTGPRKIDGQHVVSRDMFVRKGQVGGWRELFTPELEAQADKWIEENLRGTDLVFPYVKLINK